MAQELEMIDIGLISYYLGIKVKQTKNSIFISQEGYVKEVLKKFEMNMSNLVINVELNCQDMKEKRWVLEVYAI